MSSSLNNTTTTTGEQFSLVWNTFPRNLSSGLYNLLEGEQLVDVTLAAEGQILRAHKLILSVCSSYFRDLFKGNSCKHPIVILKDVNYRDLSAMLHFMYQGEVNIKQEDIGSFLKVAEILKIKGLTKTADDDDDFDRESVEVTSQITQSGCSNNDIIQNQELINEKSKTYNTSCQCHNTKKIISDHSLIQDESKFSLYNNSNLMDTDNNLIDNKLNKTDNNLLNIDDLDDDEPLDCSSVVIDKSVKSECEYLEHKTGIGDNNENISDIEILNKQNLQQDNSESSDSIPNTQMLYYNQMPQDEPLDLNENASNQKNEPNEPLASSSKGRRTVKGIAGSSLSLETTLRVISELGPTIRMERGKVIRMYSCPWCLRHFTRKENLKLHVRYIHGPLESLTCKLCGNKYKNSNSLRVHSYLYHNTQRNKSTKSTVIGDNV